jgi:ribosome recycling factor
MLNDIKADASQRMQKCIQSFQADLRKLRTGRAHPSLIEGLKVNVEEKTVPTRAAIPPIAPSCPATESGVGS